MAQPKKIKITKQIEVDGLEIQGVQFEQVAADQYRAGGLRVEQRRPGTWVARFEHLGTLVAEGIGGDPNAALEQLVSFVLEAYEQLEPFRPAPAVPAAAKAKGSSK